jgi:hypothetical protein
VGTITGDDGVAPVHGDGNAADVAANRLDAELRVYILSDTFERLDPD